MTITGKNSLYGTKTVNFEIKAKDIGNKDQEEVGMAVSVTAAAAGGADKEPVITAAYNGMTLEKGTDYTVGTDIINAGNGIYRRLSPVSETIREPTRWNIRRQALISRI